MELKHHPLRGKDNELSTQTMIRLTIYDISEDFDEEWKIPSPN